MKPAAAPVPSNLLLRTADFPVRLVKKKKSQNRENQKWFIDNQIVCGMMQIWLAKQDEEAYHLRHESAGED